MGDTLGVELSRGVASGAVVLRLEHLLEEPTPPACSVTLRTSAASPLALQLLLAVVSPVNPGRRHYEPGLGPSPPPFQQPSVPHPTPSSIPWCPRRGTITFPLPILRVPVQRVAMTRAVELTTSCTMTASSKIVFVSSVTGTVDALLTFGALLQNTIRPPASSASTGCRSWRRSRPDPAGRARCPAGGPPYLPRRPSSTSRRRPTNSRSRTRRPGSRRARLRVRART